MKILYALQGTGNGHSSRANVLVPLLRERAEVDLLISGTHCELGLSYPPKYKLYGAGFIFGKKGGIDLWKTWKELKFSRFLKEVKSIPIEEYDIIINDFEPITALACRWKKIPIISMGHQSSFQYSGVPMKRGNYFSRWILKNYAKAQTNIGFHFEKYHENIYYPIIRQEIRKGKTSKMSHVCVYLPAYGDKFLLELFHQFPHQEFWVFSKHTDRDYKNANVHIKKIDTETYVETLLSCKGVIMGGGFEGPAEAIYLGKKLLVIPMVNQYEQLCNALALEKMGVQVVWKPSLLQANISMWLRFGKEVKKSFPDESLESINKALDQAHQLTTFLRKNLKPTIRPSYERPLAGS